MYCPSCGKPRASLSERCPECGAAPLRRGGSGWTWFWAGSTLSLVVLFGALSWGLNNSGQVRRLVQDAAPALAAVPSTPGAPSLPPSAAAPAEPSGQPTAQSRSPGEPSPAAKVGEIISSGSWKVVVDGSRSAPSAGDNRLFIDFTLKNDGDRAAVLEIPSTAPQGPRTRPAALRDVQMSAPPPLELSLLDRANRRFGGSFVGADGKPSGAYTFLSAPGDAIKLTYAFDVPASSAEPFALELRFGGAAGRGRARVQLDDRAPQPARLAPSDVGKVAGKDERVEVGGLWALTVTGVERGPESLTIHMKAENLSDTAAVVAASRGDTTGSERDFYAVDSDGRLAYSSSDSMPTARVPARASRVVDVKLRAPRELAAGGPYRFSVVVDAAANQYAVFRVS